MNIRERQIGKVKIIELRGMATNSDEAEWIKSRVNGLLIAGQQKFLFNMSACFRIDETCLAALIYCQTEIQKRRGGVMKLSNLTLGMKSHLIAIGHLQSFEVCPTERKALKSNWAQKPQPSPRV